MPYVFPENGKGKCSIVNNDILTNNQKGRQIYLESIPEPEKIQGKTAILYGELKTKKVWYEYEDIIITENEEIMSLKGIIRVIVFNVVKNNYQKFSNRELDIFNQIIPEFSVGIEYHENDVIRYNNNYFYIQKDHIQTNDLIPGSSIEQDQFYVKINT